MRGGVRLCPPATDASKCNEVPFYWIESDYKNLQVVVNLGNLAKTKIPIHQISQYA